jgi:hypothetical protein
VSEWQVMNLFFHPLRKILLVLGEKKNKTQKNGWMKEQLES